MSRLTPDERNERTRENRNYLAQHEALGDISLRKSPYEASARYVDRVANNLRQQEQAGLPLDVGAGRGHARREKGRSRNPETMKATPEAYEVARRINQIEGATVTARGEIILPLTDDIGAIVDLIEKRTPNAHIVFATSDGEMLFKHGGIRAEEVQRLIEDEYEGDAQAFFDTEREKQKGQSPKKQRKRTREQEREHSARKRARKRGQRGR